MNTQLHSYASHTTHDHAQGVWLSWTGCGLAWVGFFLKLSTGPDIFVPLGVPGASASAFLVATFLVTGIVGLWNGMHHGKMWFATALVTLLSLVGVVATGYLEHVHALVR